MAPSLEHRATPRAEVQLPVTLARPNGRPVEARTKNVGVGGMCVITPRPLAVGEELRFELALDGEGTLAGLAHVCREHPPGSMYAVRFDDVDSRAAEVLARLTGQ
jgi:PilZ domain